MVFSFDGMRVDEDLFELRRGGERVPLEPQAFDVLVHLLHHRDRVVPKEELMDVVWGDRFVSESAVTSRIKQVRKALGDDGQAQRLVKTLHGRGYRFVGAASELESDGHDPHRGATSDAAGVQESPRRGTGTHNLVGSVNRLVGREAELALLVGRVDEHRLITILGPGGSGKSRLAVEVARARSDPDGPWFVELAALSDGSLLVETVSTAMGIPSAAGSLALARVLGDRRLLLVLDNCEQVTDDVAELVTCLLERCPALRVLTTSRQTLGVVGELVHVLRPLAESDAETLFLERAAAVVPQWVPDAEDRAVVAQLCRGLDGLPLAIELAAAQCRALSVHQLAGQLEDRFALLTSGRRSNRRHASMTAAIDGSYASLEATERQVFEALSLFEGSFDFEGVKAVAGGQGALQPLLSLIDKSLVTVLDGSPRRYRILETLRQYAGLHRSEEATRQTKARIVTWVCSVAEQAEAESFGPHSWEWTQRLDQDKDTIRAALSWAAPDPVTQMRIAVGMAWFWYRRGHITEGLRALEPLASLSPTDSAGSTVSSSLLVRGTVGVVLLSYLAGDYARVVGEQDRVKALAAHTDDQAAACFALALVAYFEAAGGSIEMALSDATVALETARRISSPPRASFALLAMAMAHLRADDLEKAQRCAADGLAESDSYGFTWGAVSCIWVWCKARIAAGDFSAETLAGASRIVRDSAANRDITSWLVGILCSADILFKRGEGSKAAELVGIAHRQGELIGFAPEVMDPVETKQFLVDIMHGIEAEGLTAEFERGRALDTERTFDRVHDLLDVRELLEDRSGSG